MGDQPQGVLGLDLRDVDVVDAVQNCQLHRLVELVAHGLEVLLGQVGEQVEVREALRNLPEPQADPIPPRRFVQVDPSAVRERGQQAVQAPALR